MLTVARRILWSKITNSGQICIAADYAIVSKEAKPRLIEAFKKAMLEFVPSGESLLKVDEYTKIINPVNFARLTKLLERTNGDIVFGGKSNAENQKIEVTVVDNVAGEFSIPSLEHFYLVEANFLSSSFQLFQPMMHF